MLQGTGVRVRRGVLTVAMAIGLATAAAAADVRVVDGDTIEIDGTTVRLYGIDAPEAGQRCARRGRGAWPCGRDAIAAVVRLVAAGDVLCDYRGRDDYDRLLAVCTAGVVEINRALVDDGLAWSFRRYSDRYNDAEDAARERGTGVWRSATEAPWEYRAHRWDVAAQAAPAGCPIKGNINRDGVHIYHPPWSPWYDRTKIDEGAGERWFCDEAEAVAAGWRAPTWGR